MRHILILLVLVSSLFSQECNSVFSDVLSSETAIVLNTKTVIESKSEVLQTPKLYQSKAKSKCNKKACKESGQAVLALKPFTSKQSDVNDYITIEQDTTLSDENIGNVIVTGDNVTLTFQAPPPTQGFTPLQKIGFIEIKGKNVTLEFEAGDYYIDSFEAISTFDKKLRNKKLFKLDTLTITPKGDTRLFVEKTFYISKEAFNPFEKTIVINTQKQTKVKRLFGWIPTSKKEIIDTNKLIIYAKGDIEIKTPNIYEINALIYGYGNVKILSSLKSSFKGAIHAKGELVIESSRMKRGGIFTYDEPAVNDLYKMYTCKALPDEVDEYVNNSTLLGIDSNNNGVRDDVERKVFETYTTVVKQELMMQSLKTNQKMLADPDLIQNAKEWDTPENKNLGCYYYLYQKDYLDLDRNYVKFIEDSTYNTWERISKYRKYNQALSGGVYGMPSSFEVESSCEFNVTKAVGGQ